VVLLVSAVPARRGIQGQSEQSERPRQLVPSLPRRSGAGMAGQKTATTSSATTLNGVLSTATSIR
jgi:hypothetical protein